MRLEISALTVSTEERTCVRRGTAAGVRRPRRAKRKGWEGGRYHSRGREGPLPYATAPPRAPIRSGLRSPRRAPGHRADGPRRRRRRPAGAPNLRSPARGRARGDRARIAPAARPGGRAPRAPHRTPCGTRPYRWTASRRPDRRPSNPRSRSSLLRSCLHLLLGSTGVIRAARANDEAQFLEWLQ